MPSSASTVQKHNNRSSQSHHLDRGFVSFTSVKINNTHPVRVMQCCCRHCWRVEDFGPERGWGMERPNHRGGHGSGCKSKPQRVEVHLCGRPQGTPINYHDHKLTCTLAVPKFLSLNIRNDCLMSDP